jgi:hypothetical protein
LELEAVTETRTFEERMPKTRLTIEELSALRAFAVGIRGLLALDAAAVGRIGDYLGEYGVEPDTALQDGVMMECMAVIVDAVNRKAGEN